MSHWIVPCNKSHYDLDAVISAFGFVEWRQFFNYEVGDTVYIYSTLPEGRLVYELYVERVHIPLAEISDDGPYYIKKTGWRKVPPKGFVRFGMVSPLNPENKELTYPVLVANGMPRSVQTPIRVKPTLLQHILKNIDN